MVKLILCDIWIKRNVRPSSKPLDNNVEWSWATNGSQKKTRFNLTVSTLIPIKNRKNLFSALSSTWTAWSAIVWLICDGVRSWQMCTEFSSNNGDSSESEEYLIWHSHCDLCVWIATARIRWSAGLSVGWSSATCVTFVDTKATRMYYIFSCLARSLNACATLWRNKRFILVDSHDCSACAYRILPLHIHT